MHNLPALVKGPNPCTLQISRNDADGSRLTIARAHAGVNANALTDDRAYDEASGTAVLFGTPVTVESA